jgi:hypothetical protein
MWEECFRWCRLLSRNKVWFLLEKFKIRSFKPTIDFILQKQSEIIPVEVKTTGTGHLKSLFYFCRDKNKKLVIKVSLNNYSVTDSSHQIEGHEVKVKVKVKVKLISLPQYAISSIYKITGK